MPASGDRRRLRPGSGGARSLGVARTFERVEDLLALRDVGAVVVAAAEVSSAAGLCTGE